MRIIKFRGKRIDNGEWIFGDIVTNFEYGISILTNLSHVDGAEFNCDVFGVIPESVGQFTGLKDDAEKDIYEGDIVEMTDGVFAIEWNDDKCVMQFSEGSPINDENTYGMGKVIIGNLTDNPELLKSENH